MSKPKLKKELNTLDKEALVELILELYTNRKDARDYLEFWLNPDADKEYERVKECIKRVFRTSSNQLRPKPAVSEIKLLLKNFATLCDDPILNAELMLYSVSQHCSWVLDKKKFQKGILSKIQKQLEEAKEFIITWGEEARFQIRMEKMDEVVKYISDVCEELAKDRFTYRHRRRWF